MKRLLPLTMILIAPVLLTGAARDRNQVPPATPTGEAINCVGLQNIRETRVRSDSVIDFVMRDGKVYRNTLPQSCPQLGFEQRFGYATSLSQLCSVDIITVLMTPPLTRGASCGLGKFQPVKLLDARR